MGKMNLCVNRYHAQIGAKVDQRYLAELRDKLHKQAQQCCYTKKWEEALNTFMQVLALSEKLPPSTDHGYRGILIHNIGFCLHCLGKLEAAKAYYQRCIECFEREAAKMPMSKRLLDGILYPDQLILSAVFGSATENRIRMTCVPLPAATSWIHTSCRSRCTLRGSRHPQDALSTQH